MQKNDAFRTEKNAVPNPANLTHLSPAIYKKKGVRIIIWIDFAEIFAPTVRFFYSAGQRSWNNLLWLRGVTDTVLRSEKDTLELDSAASIIQQSQTKIQNFLFPIYVRRQFHKIVAIIISMIKTHWDSNTYYGHWHWHWGALWDTAEREHFSSWPIITFKRV